MRTFCVIIFIVIFLVFVSVSDAITVKQFCADMESEIRDVRNNAKSGVISAEKVEKIKNIWNKNKTKIFVFKNHNSFDEYEDAMVDMEFSVKTNDANKLYYTSFRFDDINERLKAGSLFNIGNIF